MIRLCYQMYSWHYLLSFRCISDITNLMSLQFLRIPTEEQIRLTFCNVVYHFEILLMQWTSLIHSYYFMDQIEYLLWSKNSYNNLKKHEQNKNLAQVKLRRKTWTEEREECLFTARHSFLSSIITLSLVIKADFGTLRIISPLLRSLTAPKPLLQHSPKQYNKNGQIS